MTGDRGGDMLGLQLAMWVVSSLLLWDAWQAHTARRRRG